MSVALQLYFSIKSEVGVTDSKYKLTKNRVHNMVTLIVSDIFGHTPNLNAFAEELDSKVIICSPYTNFQTSVGQTEKQAYDLFIATMGHDGYASKVKEVLIHEQPDFIIGFSAGAVAAWRALAATPLKRVQKMIGFYPGQIRNYTNLRPRCHVDLYFPHKETHFDISPVISQLKTVSGVQCIRTRYSHGFMNALSQNFNKYAYLHYTNLCDQEVVVVQDSLANHQVEVTL